MPKLAVITLWVHDFTDNYNRQNFPIWVLRDNTWIYSFDPQVPLCCSIDSYLWSELLKTHHTRTMLGGSLFFKERTSSWESGIRALDQQFSKLKDPVLTYIITILQNLKNSSQNSTITNHHWKFIIYPPVLGNSVIVKEGTSRLGSAICTLDSQFSNIKDPPSTCNCNSQKSKDPIK
jgi:hypothetical protein